jgi:hypothetical protein
LRRIDRTNHDQTDVRRESGHVPWALAIALYSACIGVAGPAFGVLLGSIALLICHFLRSRTKVVMLFVFLPFIMLWGVALLLLFLLRP